jgi:hypothetical protein
MTERKSGQRIDWVGGTMVRRMISIAGYQSRMNRSMLYVPFWPPESMIGQ